MSNALQTSSATLGVAVAVRLSGEPGHLQIIWPEGMSPLGDTVSLVDCEQSHASFDTRHGGNESLVVESLWCAVENVELTLAHGVDSGEILLSCFGGIHSFCADAQALQCVNLVFHKSDQRRYDERDASLRMSLPDAIDFVQVLDGDARDLVAERFSTSYSATISCLSCIGMYKGQ
jgi:hypothetical protein